MTAPAAADPDLDRLCAEACAAIQRLIDLYNRPRPKRRRDLKRDRPLCCYYNGHWTIATPPTYYKIDPTAITCYDL